MTLEDIALSFVPQLGARGAAHLLDCYGSAEAVYRASALELKVRAELRESVARAIASGAGMREAEREVRYCAQNDIKIVGSQDEEYPSLLREIDDYPSVLYVRGEVEALRRRCVSFVGTRKISPYGARMCNELVSSLHEYAPDVVILSGLAYGVDAACHRAALAVGATTVAVVANPLPSVTPTAHENLAADIVAKGGAIISELNSQTKQNGRYFIPRNRLIAALGAGTVVVESPESGGSLSTAAFADGYNRSVMALPGRACDSSSRGCNMLIRNRKAQLVLSGRDIAHELMWELEVDAERQPQRKELPLTEAERQFMRHLSREPLSIDVLAVRSGMSPGELSLMLMNLELSGAVRQLPGKIYESLID